MAAEATGPIMLDLQPDETDLGKLHEPGQYLALQSYKKVFHFQVTPEFYVHGQGIFDDETSPASLVVLNVQAVAEHQARQIKWASIEVTFEKDKTRAEPDSAPRIFNVAPGRPPVKVECSTEEQTTTSSKELNFEVQGGGTLASIAGGGKKGEEKKIVKIKEYSASVSVITRPCDERDYANQVVWILEGNSSQNGGIPPDVTVAILLKRPVDGDFVCSVKLDIEVDWFSDVHEWFAKIKKWNNRAIKYHQFNIANTKQGKLQVDSSRLGDWVEAGKLREIVEIRMPGAYKKFEMKKR